MCQLNHQRNWSNYTCCVPLESLRRVTNGEMLPDMLEKSTGSRCMVWQRRIDGRQDCNLLSGPTNTGTIKPGLPQYTWFCRRSLSCFARLVELPLSKLRSCKTALLPNTHGYASSKRMMTHVAASISSITHLGSLSAISLR